MNQTSIFDIMYPKFKIDKPIRLIEFFGGYGSQALALKYSSVHFEHWKLCEWAVKSIQAYKDIHYWNDNEDYSKNMSLDQIKSYLYNKGISANYDEPMSEAQVNRLNEKQARTIYNNIIATNNLVNIQQVKGEDLEIKDTDKYCYILTYSFPCQDLSLAGRGKGMSDTTTRSGMLWEVERILTECHKLGNLPQVLLMENVPQVHSEDNIKDFHKWQLRLEELGYKNYMQDLIATDYGIPQTRNRCFMVSILGEYSYTFPQPIPLKLKLKDMLEDKVDEKYYLSDKQMENIVPYGSYYSWPDLQGNINTQCCRAADENKNALTIACANTGNVLIKNATKQGYLEAEEGDGINLSSRMEYQRGNVQKQMIQTIDTMGGGE
jgi:DNA (cytosine-5)-methyltransferase 1